MNQNKLKYIVAGYKSWNREVFENIIKFYTGEWYYFDSSESLTFESIQQINPRYIFFLHWSWKVDKKITDNYECICFHMTDVPYGRGGSPLQNLIIRGHKSTKLTALRMTDEIDAGDVYCKKEMSLEGSSAEEIYIRATFLEAEIIKEIIESNLRPVPQEGKVVIFKRRKKDESEVPDNLSLNELYDFIRMLDAEEYPKAFIEYKGFRYEFYRTTLYNGKIEANVKITSLKT